MTTRQLAQRKTVIGPVTVTRQPSGAGPLITDADLDRDLGRDGAAAGAADTIERGGACGILERAKSALDVAIDWLADKGVTPEHIEMRRLMETRDALDSAAGSAGIIPLSPGQTAVAEAFGGFGGLLRKLRVARSISVRELWDAAGREAPSFESMKAQELAAACVWNRVGSLEVLRALAKMRPLEKVQAEAWATFTGLDAGVCVVTACQGTGRQPNV